MVDVSVKLKNNRGSVEWPLSPGNDVFHLKSLCLNRISQRG